MRIILLGAPGSGKGTQARRLVETYKVPQIATGDILRAAVQEGSEAGRRAEQIMKDGGLVPDDLVIELVSQRVLKADTRRGFILDGFPRNIPQAQELDTRLGWVSRPIQIAINFEVDEVLLARRLTGRRTCDQCGAIFNTHFSPPRARGRCDECGGNLVQREDDNEETVAARLRVYREETELLVQYYRAQHKLRTLNAAGEADTIFARLCEMIDTEIRPLENKVISVHGAGLGGATHTHIVGGKIVREVSGNDIRTTKVQPRQPGEGGESRGGEAKERKTRKRASKRSAKKLAETAADSTTGDTSAPVSKTAPARKKSPAKRKTTTAQTTKKTSSARKKVVGARAATATAAKKKATAKKKPATKKTVTGKTATKKTAVKKKAAARKTVARKKMAARKTVVKKKVVRKKIAAKKTATTRKTTARKTAIRKKATKQTARKTATKKKAAGKAAGTKRSSGARKPILAKRPVKKKLVTRKKAAGRKATKKPSAAKKSPTRKSTTRKTRARR